ncbi:MAG: hypothetical protein RRY21_03285, partial [Oscillospiraceae bacterium]
MKMKRILAIALVLMLAFTMVLSLALPIFALEDNEGFELLFGDLVLKGDAGYYNEVVSTVQPGETFYIALGTKKPSVDSASVTTVVRESGKSKVKKAWRCTGNDTGEAVSLVTDVTPSIVRLKASRSESWYFVKIPVKAVKMTDYESEGYHLVGTVKVKGFDEIEINMDLCYPRGGAELSAEPQLYVYENEKNIELELPDSSGLLTLDAGGLTLREVLSVDTEEDPSFAALYPAAELSFFRTSKNSFRRSVILTVYADEGSYFYQYKGKTPTDLTKYYDEDAGGFVVKTKTLGDYVLSDQKLGRPISVSGGTHDVIIPSGGGSGVIGTDDSDRPVIP